ncbi:hypothetical protein [Nocardia sp. bgisy118]|uniref:hypothetical protein n=1 Tax=Nocardia sp. bgisy118 TaxID=3413786 RepID=UPI003F49F7B5
MGELVERVDVGALQFAGEEFQADVGGFQLLGEGGEFDSAAEAFVFVHDEGGRDTGGSQFPGEGDGVVQFGAGGDLLGEDPTDAGERPGRSPPEPGFIGDRL